VNEEGPERPGITRRRLLTMAGTLGVAGATLGALRLRASTPDRASSTGASHLPDIQHAIGGFIPAAQTIDGVEFRFGPVYTIFATIRLLRRPSRKDQATFANALRLIEEAYPFAPQGVFTIVSYGLPYFKSLPGGMSGSLARRHIPRLHSDTTRFVLEEAEPAPTDVHPSNAGVRKKTFTVPVQIESNDILLTLRSDSTEILYGILRWLRGETARLKNVSVGKSGLGDLLEVTSTRLMFNQRGLPRRLADEQGFAFARYVNPESPMWMGFADQQTSGSGPPEITTFVGNASARLTTAQPGDYFDLGSVVHLSHAILDLEQFYGRPYEPYLERVQYMFRSNPLPARGNQDQFIDGGGPSFLPNTFRTVDDALKNAEGVNTHRGARRIGHTSALQRSSRAPDGTPMHIRIDGPGLDSMDVPEESIQPKLQFSVVVPTADFFATMRRNQSAQDLASRFRVASKNQGIERFVTTTRRQNFLIPPRRHRAFPLIEMT
jgi:hypothetical protein